MSTFALFLFISQCTCLNMRQQTIQMIENVYNRKQASMLGNFYDDTATYRDNIFNGRVNILRGVEEIRRMHLQHCPVYNWLGSVFTIESSVVDEQNQTIRYIMAVHNTLLGKSVQDVVRLSVMHRFNDAGKITQTEIYGDMTSMWARLHRNILPETNVNGIKASRFTEVYNTHKNYHSLDDLMHSTVQIYSPGQEGKPLDWETSIQLQQKYDKCLTDGHMNIIAKLHEQSRPNHVAIVWSWSAKFSAVCPAPYAAFKPNGKRIATCGMTEYQFDRETGQVTQVSVLFNTEDIMNQMQGKAASRCDSLADSFKSSKNNGINSEILMI
eukprot:475766_1